MKESRIVEEGEVVDERVERGDGLDGDDEMFEEAVDAQQLSSPISNIDLGGNGDEGGGRAPLADDGESVAAYDEAESFEEAVGTPTASGSSVDGGRSEDEIATTETGEKEMEDVGAEEETKEDVDGSTEKLQVDFQKVESLDEAIGDPTVAANLVDERGTKEETQIPSNGVYEGHLETDTQKIEDVGVDEEARDGVAELNEKLQVVSEKPESFEEAVSTPTVMASVVDEKWSKDENPSDNGHESHKEDDLKDGVDDSVEKLQVAFEKVESFEEAIGTPTVIANVADEEWSKEVNPSNNVDESHKENDVNEIDGVDDSTETLQVAFEEAIGTPTVIANVADEELTKEENPPSEGRKEADLKEMEVGADKETKDGLDVPPEKAAIRDSEIKEVGAEGARNHVEETKEVAGDVSGDVDLDGSSSGVVVQSEVSNEVSDSGDLKSVENHKDDETHHGKAELEEEANGHVNGEMGSSESPKLVPRDADKARELKDGEKKEDVSSISGTNHDSNGHVEAAALSGTKSNDGENSVDGSNNSGEIANEKLERIERAVRSINAAPVSKKKDDNNEKVNKAELTSLKPMNQAPARPAGLGRAAPLLEPAPRAAAQHPRGGGGGGAISQPQPQQIEETAANIEAEEHDETREKLQMIRVKFLRLAHRLGQTPHNVVVAQVLYRLGLAEQLRGRNGGRVGAFSFDRASAMAEQLEASGQDPLDFSCTIMVLGKSGVGKSATINSIFDEAKLPTDAFSSGTKKVQDVIGTVQGIKVRVIDTPGLLPSGSDQRHNEKILHSVKRFIKKTPPDIVLYLDRLDVQSIDLSDMPLLRTITDIFGASIWFNAIVVLTHAASAPPEGPNGIASSYDMFVTQRSHVVQQAIRQAAGDMRLMNPVSLVENHSACRTNRAGQRVLPNGQVWKPHLLLLSFASKILAEANTLLKLQDSPPGRSFSAGRPRMPPLPYLLSSLLQPRPQPRLPDEDDATVDDDYDSGSDSGEESEYDELPPFKRLTKAQILKLSRAQKKAYFDELEYREKLFMKKQMKEVRRQRRMMKTMAKNHHEEVEVEEESGGAASVPVPMPDLSLPASFDSDNPTHRYRYLDTSNQWLVRPVLETQGWDHDVGYEGINVERLFAVQNKIPVSFSGQVSKDKKDANVQMELAGSIKGTTLGFDMQTVGKDLAYSLRTDTRLTNYRINKAAAGLSLTLMNEAVTVGFKVEDKVVPSKWFRMVVTGGAITSRGDVAFGGSLDATVKEKDPLGRFQSTLGLSVMDWHGDLAVGGNLQSQIPIGRSTNLIARANLNNRGTGQVSVKVNSSEQLQIALVALVPLLKKMFDYCPRQLQFGFGQQ